MAGEHRRALEAEIEDASSGLARIETQITARQKAFAKVMGADEPDSEAADALQTERDAFRREKERLKLRVSTLERQIPEADRSDAKDQLKEIVLQLERLSPESVEWVKRFEVALVEVEAATEGMCRCSVESYELRDEAESLRCKVFDVANKHGLVPPPLPDIEGPDSKLVRRLIDAHYRMLELVERARKRGRR